MSVQNQTATLLIITTETGEADRIVSALREGGLSVNSVIAPHADRLDQYFTERECDMILCCAYDRDVDLAQVLSAHRKLKVDLPLFVITTAETRSEDLIKARRAGARDLIERNDYEYLKWAVAREFSDLLKRREAADLTDRLQRCQKRSRELIDVTNVAVAFIQEGLHVAVNPAYAALFGYPVMDDLLAVPFLDLVVTEQQKQIRDLLRSGGSSADQEPVQLKVTCRGADQSQFAVDLLAAPDEFEDETGLRLLLRVPETARAPSQGVQPAPVSKDEPGLQDLLDEIERHIGDERVVEHPFAIYYVKVTKTDELMRDLGLTLCLDLLNGFSATLQSLIGERGFLARVSQDGFGIIADGLGEFEAKSLAAELTSNARLSSHGSAKGPSTPDCEVGYYLVHGRSAGAEDIVNAAYRLCIRHEFTDKDHPSGITAPTSLAARAKQDVEDGDIGIARKIEYALHHDQLRLVYQPIISLMGDSQENYTVLIRLLDEQENLMEAKDFIGPAIRAGLIEKIDKWAIRTAIQIISEQRRAGHNICLFINLSEDTFRDPGIVLWICDCLREFDVRGNWLTFLFQEELVASNLGSISKLVETLKKIKCRVAVNRFGVSERPELLLQGLSLDFVLLKPSFANDLADDQSKQKRLLELANLAREFNVKSIVTGVEDARALTVLWTAGVDYVQGNFLQRPSPTLEVQG